jgi:hypothetical protein
MGISVLALIAVAKMTWSVIYGGEAEKIMRVFGSKWEGCSYISGEKRLVII